MREDPCDRNLRQADHVFDCIDELVRLEAEAIQVGIDLDVNRGRALSLARSGTDAPGELARAPERELDVRRSASSSASGGTGPITRIGSAMPPARSASASSIV